MKNLRSIKELTGYAVHAVDGDIGKVRELYFDDVDWRVRYLVVDTNRWLPGRKVLVPPSTVNDIFWEQREVRVAVTKEQVKDSPNSATDQPIALQLKAEKKVPFNWAVSLAGEALLSVPEAWETPAFEPINKNGKPFNPHLRTTRVVIGLTLRAKDGVAGRIVDFIVDDDSWDIRYLVIDLANDKRVLFLPRLVKDILIEESVVTCELPMRLVADGPTLDPSTLLTHKYEEAVLRHYQSNDHSLSANLG
jgi:hypothetical protein